MPYGTGKRGAVQPAPSTGTCVDVLVVGAGPCGLSAALVLARARRDVLVVDAGEPRNAAADRVHGVLTRDGTPPGELLALGRAEVERCGARVVAGRVTALAGRAPEGFTADLADGSRVRARRVVVATGLHDELPEVPGLAQRWGRDVLHCPYCHGAEVADEPLAVLGSGPHDADEALLLRQWSDRVVLVLPEDVEVDDLPARRMAARGVEVVRGRVTGLRVQDDALAGLELAGGAAVACRALFLGPVLRGRDDLLRRAGARTEPSGFGDYAVTQPSGLTTVPGLYATGNVASPAELVVDALAAGSRTAVAVNYELAVQDADDALARTR